MANEKHLAIFKQGVEVWNEWREEHPSAQPDLSRADLRSSNFSRANLSQADLTSANFSFANLTSTNLSNANLRGVNLSFVKLSRASLSQADLSGADLCRSDLSKANLNDACLIETNLRAADLHEADLSRADLNDADLCFADLNKADLTSANLWEARVLRTNLSEATLTGACIADWQLGELTKLANIRCDYIFRTFNRKTNEFSGRLPVDPSGTFAPGEFEEWVKVRESSLETIDITFTEGIDWQAFFNSLQEVRRQYPNSGISMQSIEEKDGTYVVRLRLDTGAMGEDLEKLRAEVETKTKALYESERRFIESCGEIKALERSLDKALEKLAMANNYNENITFNQQGANISGGVAGKNYGSMTTYINQNSDDIHRLIATLREQAQAFPVEQKDEAIDVLDALQSEIEKPQPDQNRIGRYWKRLVVVVTAVGTIAGGVSTFSGNLKDIKDNAIELGETLGIPVESVQPKQIPPADTP